MPIARAATPPPPASRVACCCAFRAGVCIDSAARHHKQLHAHPFHNRAPSTTSLLFLFSDDCAALSLSLSRARSLSLSLFLLCACFSLFRHLCRLLLDGLQTSPLSPSLFFFAPTSCLFPFPAVAHRSLAFIPWLASILSRCYRPPFLLRPRSPVASQPRSRRSCHLLLVICHFLGCSLSVNLVVRGVFDCLCMSGCLLSVPSSRRNQCCCCCCCCCCCFSDSIPSPLVYTSPLE